MKTIKYITLFLLTLMISHNVFSQRFREFSGNADNYISELEQLYQTDVNMKKEQTKAYDSLISAYTIVWNNFNAQHKRDVIKLSQIMLKKNIRARNGFYEFIQTQIAFQSSNQSAESYNQWLKGMEEYISEHNIKIYNDAVDRTYNLIKNKCLYLSNTSRWQFGDGASFIFRVDSTRGVYADFTTNIDLTYATQKDSNIIHYTKGRLYLMENLWEGHGGVVTWEKVGLSKDSVFVRLNKYLALVNHAALVADSVSFTNKEYFSHTLKGSFEDVCSDNRNMSLSNYPKFISYKREEIIKNVFPNIDYVGGFTQQGGKFLGTGDQLDPAKLVFYKDNKKFMVAKALTHPFSREGIITEDCQVTFYVNQDSICHPGTKMNYNKTSHQIFCSDNKKGISASPWVDSYHCLDIYTEAVYTSLDDHTIEFTSVKGPVRNAFATFESNNYYSDYRWYKIQGIDEVSPLYKVKSYCDKNKVKQFTVKQFSNYTGLDQTQCKLLLMNLSLNGFITYESYRETAIMKQKLYDYVKAKVKKQDYDALRFQSTTTNGEPNAVLNIYDMDLRMHGIEKFSLSDSHNVAVTPLKGEMVMQKNRDFVFDGNVAAGRFRMAGKQCKFSYDDFTLKLPQMDSMTFFVPSFNDTNTLVLIQTPIQKLDCQLVIDSSNNKSSIKKIDGYPVLTSLKNSYVYYDYAHIQNGVYSRDKFYYELQPFQIRNIFSFKTDSIILKGTLKSAGIFPDINQPLVVMRDYSLGFKMTTLANGLALYGGKGTYHQSIDLSSNGLLGTGIMDYENSRSNSKMFVFHPDSMFCQTFSFKYTSPKVTVTKTNEHFYPYQDYMLVEQAAEPFNMYDSIAFHSGYLKVAPSGLTGGGENKSAEMIVKADLFKFAPNSYTSDSSNFTLNALDGKSVAFVANNVRSNVDFASKKGNFTSMDSLQISQLPYLQYACQVDKFSWDMQNKQLALLNSSSTNSLGYENKPLVDLIDLPQPGATFFSTHPQQDSLTFNAVNAKLDLRTNKLLASGVFLVHSADAVIKPISTNLTIHPGAQMDTIDKADIVFSVENRIHKVHDARVHIASGKLYSANGYIDYKDIDNNITPIFFKEITSATGSSVGYADVLQEKPLNLNSAFKFYGQVAVISKDTNMSFDGGVSLTMNCGYLESPWLKFASKIDQSNIEIPISEAPVDVKGNRITTSILFDEKTLEPKVAFFTSDKEADNVFMKAKGWLSYDKASGEYRIASKEKLADMKNVIGDYLSINKTTCKAQGQGKIEMGIPIGSAVKMNNYGQIRADNKTTEATIKMSLAVNFPFSEQALDAMGNELYQDMNLSPIEFENSRYKDYMYYLYGQEKGEEMYSELVNQGEWKNIPKEMNYTIFLPEVNMQWDPVRRSYLSYGDVELGIVGNHQINKKIKARVQLIKIGTGTEIRIYLEANPDSWYFFDYNGVSMGAISSDENFNDIIKNTPNKQREMKADNGKVYIYRLCSPSEKRTFIKNIELNDYKDSGDNESGDSKSTEKQEEKTEE
jgi:hypothetical protein